MEFIVYCDMAGLYGYAIFPLDIYCIYSPLFSLRALSRQTITCSDRQDRVVATGAVRAQDGNAERFCLHGRAAHALLLHSSLLQGVDGLTATFALRDRQTCCYESNGCVVTPLKGSSTDLTVVQFYLVF